MLLLPPVQLEMNVVVMSNGVAALESDVGKGTDAVFEVPFEEALALWAMAKEGLQ
jgi:hypothetical protein